MKHFLNKNLIIITLIQILYFPSKGWTEPIPVFVSIVPQKYFVERVGGDEVKVHVMVKAGESPATFNPNPKKMSELANSNLYFSIGVPFEKIWISRIKAIQPSLIFVPLNNALPPKKKPIHIFGLAHPSQKLWLEKLKMLCQNRILKKQSFSKITIGLLLKTWMLCIMKFERLSMQELLVALWCFTLPGLISQKLMA
jgi:hypothetical protein